MIALIAPTAPEAVTSLLFDQLVDSGWICLEAHGLKHWAEKSGLLCGAKVPPEVFTVLDRGPLVYDSQFSACQTCVSKLVHREFALPFRVGQRVISRAHSMTLRGKIDCFFLFPDGQPGLDITREWDGKRDETGRDDFLQLDTRLTDWYRYAHECEPLEDHPMTQTTTKKASATKNLPVKAKQDSSKKVKVPAVTPASAETSAQGLVESATCPETGATYSVGDWVSYSIKGVDMIGQVLLVLTQAPPYQTVAEVPNHTSGRPWTLELRELQPAQAPDADSSFPVTEADIDAAITGTPTPGLTPVDAVAETDGYTPRPGDDVRVRSGRPDVAVITDLSTGRSMGIEGVIRKGDTQYCLPRLDALSRLHALAQASEVAALPCTPERAARGARKDRIARAWHAELLAGAEA